MVFIDFSSNLKLNKIFFKFRALSVKKSEIYKKKTHISVSLFRTQSRSRTGTSVTSLVFETNASTDSAIWACGRPR